MRESIEKLVLTKDTHERKYETKSKTLKKEDRKEGPDISHRRDATASNDGSVPLALRLPPENPASVLKVDVDLEVKWEGREECQRRSEEER